MGALEDSKMVTEDEVRQRTFSGTIWDRPEGKEKDNTLQKGDAAVAGNGVLHGDESSSV